MADELTFGAMTWEILEEKYGIREAPRRTLVEAFTPVEPSAVLVEVLRRGHAARLVNERARIYRLVQPVLSELETLRPGKFDALPEVSLEVKGV